MDTTRPLSGHQHPAGPDTNTYFSRREVPVDMDLDIAWDTALVAASSSGLGKAAAAALAEEGANVVINGRDADRLERTAAALRESAAGEVYPVAADLTDPAEVAALVETTVAELGGIDHLVTNAGGPPSGPFLDTTDAQWRDAYELLVGSAVRLCRAASDPLRADGGGTVTAITSKSVKEAVDGLVLSNAVRMAVVGLAKTLSQEWAPEVRANVVMPGNHATDRMVDILSATVERGEFDSVEAGERQWASEAPLGRFGDPERFGQVVAFLASEPASFVDGAALMVDGGEARSIL